MALGWDFDASCDWVGSDTTGYQVLRGLYPALFAAQKWEIDGTRIISRALNSAKQDEGATITAKVVSPYDIQSVTVHYGYAVDAVTQSLPMTLQDDMYTATIPTERTDDIYYYIEVHTSGDKVTKPTYADIPIIIDIDDGTIDGTPIQITIVPDTQQGGLRFGWLTVPEVTETVIQYKP